MLHARIGVLLAPLPPDEPLGQRLLVCAVCLLVGAWMIYIGRLNVRARATPRRRAGARSS
jgi:hypothetical protein